MSIIEVFKMGFCCISYFSKFEEYLIKFEEICTFVVGRDITFLVLSVFI
jgi:hypothetical protein